MTPADAAAAIAQATQAAFFSPIKSLKRSGSSTLLENNSCSTTKQKRQRKTVCFDSLKRRLNFEEDELQVPPSIDCTNDVNPFLKLFDAEDTIPTF